MRAALIFGIALGAAGAAAASEREPLLCGPTAVVIFNESAPRDIVRIRNESPDGWRLTRLTWRLEGSAGDLIFDTEPGGPGSSVAQPFRDGGGATLSATPAVADGDRTLALDFDAFAAGAAYSFTIDLDDRVGGVVGTMIAGSEIEGSEAEAEFVDADGRVATIWGVFDQDATARLEAACSA